MTGTGCSSLHTLQQYEKKKNTLLSLLEQKEKKIY
jgi:hypothetical protein